MTRGSIAKFKAGSDKETWPDIKNKRCKENLKKFK